MIDEETATGSPEHEDVRTLEASRKQPSPASMRHELRTPLNHIIGYSEMLLEEASERDLGDFVGDLQKIQTAGKKLLALINTLIDPAAAGSPSPGPKIPTTPALFRDEKPGSRPAECAICGNILVVDDNEGNRDMLSRRLRQEGYAVCGAENGRRALELVKTQPVDLVLLDVMMPEMDGYETLKHLKADSTWRDIPVIMISALDEIESVVRCIERGAEDYLPKPFDPVLLRARIGACLEKKRLRDQEVLYLRDVSHVTDAAAAIEAGQFGAQMLTGVAERPDELGQLARVFQRMAHEIFAREQQLKQQIQALRIEIDQTKKAHQVSEITETEYFQDLQKKVRALRNRPRE
ncbi:MAG: response regulator [Candidatus Methylomirabilales bacterium]